MLSIDVERYLNDSDYEETVNESEFKEIAKCIELKNIRNFLEFLIEQVGSGPQLQGITAKMLLYYPEEYREDIKESLRVLLRLRGERVMGRMGERLN